MMQIKKKFNNIETKTKIRHNGTGFLTTIPKVVIQLLNIQDGDHILWDIDIENNIITVELKQKDEE